jgi:hypothetical protein
VTVSVSAIVSGLSTGNASVLRKLAVRVALFLRIVGSVSGPRRVALADWSEMRGPNRDGISRETGLIDRWALNGENFLLHFKSLV